MVSVFQWWKSLLTVFSWNSNPPLHKNQQILQATRLLDRIGYSSKRGHIDPVLAKSFLCFDFPCIWNSILMFTFGNENRRKFSFNRTKLKVYSAIDYSHDWVDTVSFIRLDLITVLVFTLFPVKWCKSISFLYHYGFISWIYRRQSHRYFWSISLALLSNNSLPFCRWDFDLLMIDTANTSANWPSFRLDKTR